MHKQRSAEKVTLHIAEAREYQGRSLVAAVLDVLLYHQVAGATVTRQAGITPAVEAHPTVLLHLLPQHPVLIEFVESAEKVEALLPQLHAMMGSGLVEVQPVQVAKPAQPRWRTRSRGEVFRSASLLIWVGNEQRSQHKPLYQALVASLRSHGIAGATVQRAIAGYVGGTQDPHQGRPVLITAEDTRERVNAWLPVLRSIAPQALALVAETESLRYRRQKSDQQHGEDLDEEVPA